MAVADLEKLAVRRDRGYLMRLALLLAAGAMAGMFLMSGLTGNTVTGCLTDAMLGGSQQPAESKPAE